MRYWSFILRRRAPAAALDGLTFGQRAADSVANGMGSWNFISWQTAFIVAWCVWNVIAGHPWDPYPFILLNLMFSTQAAYSAPIIMMSQNRQAMRDRETMEHIRDASDRIDRIVSHIEHDEDGVKARMDELEAGHGRIIELLKGRALTDDQIKRMAERFLGWRLPENFNPDGGISFEPTYQGIDGSTVARDPTGTNLFDCQQAEAMVRYLAEALAEAGQ
ncbi:MAG: DUF1003 domain-containing protein [Betaproteobacteria bacterium]|nr:DUF1003 domain-containing protein [Betaproteobacteria bacterium]